MLSVPLRHHSQTDTSIRCWRQAYSEVRLGSDGGAQQRRQLCGIVRVPVQAFLHGYTLTQQLEAFLERFLYSIRHGCMLPAVLKFSEEPEAR